MAEFSNYFEDVIINLMRATNFIGINVSTALFTANTNLESNAPTGEVSGGSYARQPTGLSAPSGGLSSNSANISFPTATAAWGLLTDVALVDSVNGTVYGTNVNVMMWSPLDASKNVQSGESFVINAGDINVIIA